MASSSDLESLLVELHSLGCIKFGSFVLKSGLVSPFYFDMRLIVSYPSTLRRVADVMWNKHLESSSKLELMCGVPYTALPIATVLSVDTGIPMLVRRKEKKDYGTAKMIEGAFKEGQTCLIVEDVVTTGSSVLETAELLRDHGLVVTDALVFLDRQQGGRENLKTHGIELHSVVDLCRISEVMLAREKISRQQFDEVNHFVSNNKKNIPDKTGDKSNENVKKVSLEHRLSSSSNALAKAFFTTMVTKRSNLCVALDVSVTSELFKLIEMLGPLVCCFKLHVDILQDFSGKEDALRLRALAKKHDFWLMEDRKLAEIGHVASLQLFNPRLCVEEWANLLTIHAVAGPGVFDAVYERCKQDMGVVVVAQMSSEGNLMNKTYSEEAVKMLEKAKNAFGLVCQSKNLTSKNDLIQFVPGVNMAVKEDKLGQRYVGPDEAVLERGADVVIVGRGIIADSQPFQRAEEYRNIAWKALMTRTNSQDD